MATRSSNRDVTLTLAIQSLGAEGIKELQTAVEQLARDGSAAAPEFQQLADQISRLGEQNQALSAFRSLSDETDQLRARQEAATQSTSQMATRLDALRDATEQARRTQQQAAAEYDQADIAVTKATGAIRAYKAETDQVTKQTADYRIKLGELVRAQTDAATALREASQARRDANTALREASSEEAKLEKQYARSTGQLAALDGALKEQESSLRDAAAAAEALGLSTADVAQAEGQLLTALQGTAARVNERSAAIKEMAEADRLAAIQEQGMLELLRRGEQALQAETLAQRDAARAAQEYERAKAAAAASNAAWQQEATALVDAAHAAEQLARETKILAEVQRELAAQNTFEQQAESARKLIQASEYVRFWESSLEQAEAQARQTADAAAAAAAKIDTAFSTLGVRSIQEVQREIAETRVAMATLGAAGTQTGSQLAGAFAAGEARIKGLEREIRELNGTLTTGDRLAGLFKNSLGQIAAGNLVADAVGYLINKIKELGAAFVTTIAQTEALRRGLMAVYSDAGTVATQMVFLRNTALSAGVAVGDLGPSFLKFSAATRSANIPLSVTNELFAAVTKAAGTLGLEGEQVSGMLEALSQMASKGAVSMEELRQQLGDRLPGALSLVAQGFKITEADLIKLVESGQLAARDLFPALTKSLQSMSGEVVGLTPAWENFKTVLTQTAQNAGDAGWTQLLTTGIKALTAAVAAVVLPLTAFTEVIFGVAKAAGVLAGALVTLTNPLDDLKRIASEAAERQQALAASFNQVLTGATPAKAAVQGLGLSIQETTRLSAALETTTISTAAGLKLQETATKLMGDATLDASQKIVSMNVEVGKLLPQLEAQSIAADKTAKAVKIEGDALVATIALRGSERDALEAQLTATQKNLDATTKAAAARQAEAEALIIQRDTLIRLASAQEGGVAARKQEIEAIEKKILTSSAEAEQSRAAVSQLQQEVAARGLARQAYEDNSKSLDQFRAAAVASQVALEELRRGAAAGTVTQAQFNEAQRGAAIAMGLYRDAINDTISKIDAMSKLEQANYNVKQAGLSVQQQAYQQLAAAAKATGDLSTATYYEIEAKKLQIQITKLLAEAKGKEAQATILAANAELKALEAAGPVLESKRLEIEARLANAKAKQIEAEGSKVAVRALQAEIDAIQSKGNALQGENNQLNNNSSALDRNNASRERSIQLRQQEQRVSSRGEQLGDGVQEVGSGGYQFRNRDGMTSDARGNVQTQGIWTRALIIDYLKNAGLSEALAEDLSKQFTQPDGSVSYTASAAQRQWGGKYGTLSEALGKMADYYRYGGGKVEGQQRTAFLEGQAKQKTPAAADAVSTKTVTINIGGKSQNIDVASDADVQNLTSILRQLESAAGRSAP